MVRIHTLTLFVFSLIGLCWVAVSASAQPWQLPHQVTDANTHVTFTVDSTWHTVRGITSGITGTISQSDAKDPLSIVVDLAIPVTSFNTDGESRDERLREVMDAANHPAVRFVSSRLSQSCHPLRVAENKRCAGTLEGTLSIRDVSRAIALPVELELEDNESKISGNLDISWADYHVEDPSILIAKLAPIVTVTYSLAIPKPPPR